MSEAMTSMVEQYMCLCIVLYVCKRNTGLSGRALDYDAESCGFESHSVGPVSEKLRLFTR